MNAAPLRTQPIVACLRTAWLLAGALSAAAPVAAAAGETLRDVVFAEYTEYSSNGELLRRLASPLTELRLEQGSAGFEAARAGQAITLPAERFIVYVPPQQPPGGFGLLVFVPPWQEARIPPGWAGALDRNGTIFVSAAHSGNEENVMARREPLAVLAAHNIMHRYPVDPQRVYIGGFSGGGRVALRLALGYPDLFRGAVLNAGSDPIGDEQIPLPPRDLFSRFQESTHLVYVTGSEDATPAAEDARSMRSMHEWCVFNVESYPQPRIGHEVASAAMLAHALESLLKAPPAEARRLSACRSGIERELATALENVGALLASGRPGDARRLLEKIDRRFGGLAAPRSTELARAADEGRGSRGSSP
jgi:predicted esterase